MRIRRSDGANARTLLLGLLLSGAAGAAQDPAAAGAGCPPPTAPQHSAAALFNAGNSYARDGNVGMAVLCYERARIFAPADPDILANLHQVRASAALAGDSGGWLDTHARVANPNVLYLVGLAGLLMAAAGLLTIRFFPRRRRSGWLTTVLGVPLMCLAGYDAAATWHLLQEAVVMRPATVRVSPAVGGDTLFALPVGQVVRISDEYRDFALIRTDAGRAGWVARADLVKLL